MKKFLYIPALVLVGDKDTKRNNVLRKSEKIDRLQGKKQLARGLTWVSAMRKAARQQNLNTRYGSVQLSGCNHSFTKCVKCDGIAQLIFRHYFWSPALFILILSIKCISVLSIGIILSFIAEKNAMAADSNSDYFHAEFGKGISFSTEDNNFKAKLGGLLQVDEVLHNTNNTLVSDHTGIRRGRVTLGMQFYRDWDLRATYDLTADHTDIRGFQLFFLRYKGFRRTQFRIGNLQELVGLDWLTSSRNTVFMERAQMTSLIPTIHLGFVANTWGDSWTLSSGIFGARPIDGISTENEWGVSSRFTYTPIRNSETVLHFGVSGAYREFDQNASSSSINIRDFNAENVRFSSVGRIRNYNEIIATELAAMKKTLSMQFEYLHTFRNHPGDGIQSSNFDSWYIQASWLLTGEIRRYSKRNGTFGQVNPNNKFTFNGGTGAWEIAARYSELNRVTGPRELGKGESNITLGLNWYPFRHIRIMANYIRVHSDLSLTDTIVPKKEHANIFATRVQIEF